MTHPFLSSANDNDLPTGTYIAAGLSSVASLADHLDTNPNVTVTRLFLSDSSVWDFDNNYGFSKTTEYDDDIDVPDEEEDRRSHNNKVRRRRARTMRDHSEVLERILNRTSHTLEAFSYLLHIEEWEYLPTRPRPRRSFYDSGYDPRQPEDEGPKSHFLSTHSFPRLRELVLKDPKLCDYRLSPDDGSDYNCQPMLSQLPNVSHLHLIGRYPLTLATLRSSLPNLTSIRFTGGAPNGLWIWKAAKVGWAQTVWINLGASPPMEESLAPIPDNLTVIIHPDYNPDLGISGPRFCATSSVEYDGRLRKLGKFSGGNMHLSWPIEEDFKKYSRIGLFPVVRAIETFKDLMAGGEGDWKIPEGREWEQPPLSWWWRADRYYDSIEEEPVTPYLEL